MPDCAAFFLQLGCDEHTARQIDVNRRWLEPRWSVECHNAECDCRLDHERHARCRSRGQHGWYGNGFIANSTSSIFAQGWDARAPEDGRRAGGAAGLLKAVQAEYNPGTSSAVVIGPVTMPAPSKSTVTSSMTSDNRLAAPVLSSGPSRTEDPLGDLCWLLFVLPGPRGCMRWSCSHPFVLTVKYSFYKWNGVTPAIWVGLRTT